MHIVILTDQNLHTAGGAQASVRLQRKYLQKLGHKVSICSPWPPNSGWQQPEITMPSLTGDRENGYRVVLPGRRVARAVERQMLALPPVDIIHIQGDFGVAVLGQHLAAKHHIPCALTYHSNLELGIRGAVGPVQQVTVKSLVAYYGWRYLGESFTAMYNSWRYLAALGRHVDARLTPTRHFAKLLQSKGVPGPITVMSNGLDDEQMAHIESRVPKDVTIIWAGRMSGEKRPIEFLQAVQASGIKAKVDMYGSGALLAKVRKFANQPGLRGQVWVHGHIAHGELLQRMATASLLAQSSYGFDTQGMTIFEAASLGLQVVVCDSNLSEGIPAARCTVAAGPEVAQLATALQQAVGICRRRQPGSVRPKLTTHLQSVLTAQVVQVYQGLLAKKAGN